MSQVQGTGPLGIELLRAKCLSGGLSDQMTVEGQNPSLTEIRTLLILSSQLRSLTSMVPQFCNSLRSCSGFGFLF